ncbi:MAG: nitrogenase component 1 [Oscillospiraceae bacterium]|jgi:hypothetical protein
MLKRVFDPDAPESAVRIAEADFPAPFRSGLEYGAPARGPWNIVHVGMLIPEAHQIFVCAQGCLRGVVLTAAEMGAQERFSTIAIRENNVLEGDMESLIIEGVTDVLQKLPTLPPAVLVFTSCIHHFMGCDLELCYRELRRRFPGVAFTDCYMNPIMRKSGLTPDQLMRRQLYSLLEPRERNENSISILGNCFPTDETSELLQMLRAGGKTVKDITLCRSYHEYLTMAESATCITMLPPARAGGDALAERLGMKHLYLPVCWGYAENAKNLDLLAETLRLPRGDDALSIERAETALRKARTIVGNTPIAIDYTATPRPLGLARLLTEHGFNVVSVYADSFTAEEKADFDYLQAHAPALMLRATVEVRCRVLPRETDEPVLAVGQKAAYFTGTRNFVNVVEGGGAWGFDGIVRMARELIDAYLHEKDPRTQIQPKGLGCGYCV